MPDDDSDITSIPLSLRRSAGAAWRLFRRSLRWWLLLIALLFVAWLVAERQTAAQLRAEYDKLRAAGQPFTLSELAPTIPPGEKNAAEAYLVAMEFLPEDPVLADFDLLRSDRDRAREALKPQETGLRLLKEATAIEHSAFPTDWTRPGYELTFPHFGSMREAARRLIIEAHLLAADGKSDQALDSLAAVFRLGEHAKAEPILIAQLVGYGVQGMATTSLQEILSTADPSPAALHNLFDQLGRLEFSAPMHRALLGERATGLGFFGRIRQSGGAAFGPSETAPAPPLAPIVVELYRTLGLPLLNLDEIAYLQYMEEQIAAFDLAWSARLSEYSNLDDADAQFLAQHRIISAMIAPVFSRADVSMRRSEAFVATARAALAAKAFRAERGRYPDSLAGLEAAGWDLPRDPFTGTPLRYRRNGDNFVVWSLGPDMKDDNAAEYDYQTMSYQDGPYDLPFFCDRGRAEQQAEERRARAEEQARAAAEAEREEVRRAAAHASSRPGRAAGRRGFTGPSPERPARQ